MNYRHAFHAGNFADVVKHAVLARIVAYLKEKPAAFRVIDTHAGAGAYDLAGPEADRTGSLVDGYARLLADPDPLVREKAARDWCDWEASHVDVDGTRPPPARYGDPVYRMCFARLVTHYWRHAAWLPDGELLRNVGRIAHLPAVLIHGRLDLSSPPDIAWQLAQSWPAARLHLVPGVGHSSGGVMADHLVDFLDDVSRRV